MSGVVLNKFEAMRLRGVVSRDDDDSSQADTEESPEPAQHGPPAPVQFPILPAAMSTTPAAASAAAASRRTPSFSRQSALYRTRETSRDNDSLPSLPDAPSPYSPPPSSLFSGEEWSKKRTYNLANKSSRSSSNIAPMREVRVSNHHQQHQHLPNYSSDNDTFYSDRSLERILHRTLQQPTPAPVSHRLSLSPSDPWTPATAAVSHQQQQQHSSSAAAAAAAVDSLQQNLDLARQENKAMADSFQSQFQQLQQAAHDEVTAGQQRELALQEQIAVQSVDVHDLTALNESLEGQVKEYLNGTQHWLDEAENKQTCLQTKLQAVVAAKEEASAELITARQENELMANEWQARLETCDLEKQVATLELATVRQENQLQDKETESKLQSELKSVKQEYMQLACELESEKEQAAAALVDVAQAHELVVGDLSAKLQAAATEKEQASTQATNLNQDNERLCNELQETKSRLDRDSAGKKGSTQEIESLQTQNAELSSKIREHKKEAANKIKTTKNELEGELASFRKEHSSMGLEMDRLKAIVKEKTRLSTKTSATASANVSKLEAEIDRLRTLLKETNGKNDKRRENEVAEESASTVKLQAEVDRLQALLEESDENYKVLRAKDAAETANDAAGLQDEVDRLQTLLKETNGKNNDLRAEKVALRKELVQRHRSRQDASCQTDYEVEASPAAVAGDSATQTMSTQTVGVTFESTSELPVDSSQRTKTVDTDPGLGGGSKKMLTERVVRIRDAAERAALVQDYRREIDRLKTKHEADRQVLAARHDKSLQKVIQSAKSELHSRTKEYKRLLDGEYAAKIAELERKHGNELTKLRQESDREAASKMTFARQDESAERKRLQDAIRQLQQDVATERENNGTRDDLALVSARGEWEVETDRLLESIQKECNSVFDRSKPATKTAATTPTATTATSTSPRTVFTDLVIETGNKQAFVSPWSVVEPRPEAAVATVHSASPVSLNMSELDRALDETEAIVRSLVGNDYPRAL